MRIEVRDQPAQGGWPQLLALVGALVLPAWILRSLALLQFGHGPAITVARGFVADLVAALFCLFVVLLAARWRRWIAVVLALVWTLLQYANYEHVRALDAPLSLTYAAYLKDPVFFFGSGAAPARPFLLLILLVLAGSSAWWILGRQWLGRQFVAVAGLALAGCGILWLWSVEPQELAWRRTHFLAEEMRRSAPAEAMETLRTTADLGLVEEVGRTWQPDLSGEPWTRLDRTGYNVLLIVLEGVSAAYLPGVIQGSGLESKIKLPNLDRLADSYPVVTRFVGQQRQTNRGLYALLCGRSPKLDSSAPHLNSYVLGPSEPCLPEVLSAGGYRTVFLQASPLSFMMKGQAMPRLGFDTVIGERGDEPAYSRTEWGIDDRAFLQLGFDQVRELQAIGEPWFLTLLTVGTHHPYTFPDKATSPEGTDLSRAMRYLDEAVGHFVDNLKDQELLENTLVVLTSDESAGLFRAAEGLARTLSQNWGIAVMMFPEAGPRRIEEPFLQSDVALSVLDFLGEEGRAAPFTGRSLFRTYTETRPLFFANTHQGRTYGFFPPQDLLACREDLADCLQFDLSSGGLFSGSSGSTSPKSTQVAMLRAAIELARGGPGADSAAAGTYPLLDDPLVPVMARRRKVFDAQYLDVPPSMVVEVEFEGEVLGEQGWVHLRHELVSREERHFRVRWPVLGPGDRFRVHYRLHPSESLVGLISRTSADLLDTDRLDLRFEVADLTIARRDESGEWEDMIGLEVLEESVERRIEPRPIELELDPRDWSLAACATLEDGGEIVARGCPAGESVITGPRFYAPAGARFEFVYRLTGLEGTSRIRSRVDSETPPLALMESAFETLRAGQTLDLVISFEMDKVLDELVLGLQTEHGSSAGAVFRVQSTSVEMVLP